MMMKTKTYTFFVTVISSFMLALNSHSAQFDNAKITTHTVAGNVYMLSGPGGNVGVLATPDGLLMIDDKYEPLAEKIETAMKSIIDKPLKYIVNTHTHRDHVGGNTHFSHHAPIFAHANVRKRLSSNEDHHKASLPVVTYEDKITIHLSDETIVLTHYPMGHTDGDSVVHFKKANVLHMGDLFFQGRFPYIDLGRGGSVKGYLKNIKNILNTFPKDITIIPGHGDITNMEGLKQSIAMMEFSINHVEESIKNGLTIKQIIKRGLGKKYKAFDWNFITEKKWLTTLYTDLK